MNFSGNKYDAIESIIFESGLRIKGVNFYPELDMMLIVLNNKKVMQRSLSNFPLLKKASLAQLNNYELIGGGVALHWPDLDEDLSLKGFLKEELVISNLPLAS